MPTKSAPTVRPAYKFSSKKLTLASIIHPLVLLAVYAAQWTRLLADPVATLRFSLLPLSVIQIAYAHTCLETQAPPSSSPPSGSSSGPLRKPKPGLSRLGPGSAKRAGNADAGTGLSEDLLVRGVTLNLFRITKVNRTDMNVASHTLLHSGLDSWHCYSCYAYHSVWRPANHSYPEHRACCCSHFLAHCLSLGIHPRC